MCVQVEIADISPDRPVWDRPSVSILIGPELTEHEALRQVRALLARLGADQPCGDARCWCGDQVTIPAGDPHIPRQRDGEHHERARRGAT